MGSTVENTSDVTEDVESKLGVVVRLFGRTGRIHVTAGTDTWEPTKEELQELATLFEEAELDPRGSVVVTRRGVEVTNLREVERLPSLEEAAEAFATIYCSINSMQLQNSQHVDIVAKKIVDAVTSSTD